MSVVSVPHSVNSKIEVLSSRKPLNAIITEALENYFVGGMPEVHDVPPGKSSVELNYEIPVSYLALVEAIADSRKIDRYDVVRNALIQYYSKN